MDWSSIVVRKKAVLVVVLASGLSKKRSAFDKQWWKEQSFGRLTNICLAIGTELMLDFFRLFRRPIGKHGVRFQLYVIGVFGLGHIGGSITYGEGGLFDERGAYLR